MNSRQQVLLLVGSPGGAKSTSESLGAYLLAQLLTKGFATEKVYIYPSVNSKKGRAALLAEADRADLVILVFPLYVDSLPAPVTRTLELIHDHRRQSSQAKATRFMAMTNCGFPEAHQCQTALSICRLFARQAGFEWAGGLALGGGGAIGGKPLEKAGGMAKSVRKALELAGTALAEGQSVPQAAVDLMAKPLMPTWLYLFSANLGWHLQARKNKVRKQLRARPFQR